MFTESEWVSPAPGVKSVAESRGRKRPKIVLLLSSLSTYGGVESLALRTLRFLPEAGADAHLAIAFREGERFVRAGADPTDVTFLSGARRASGWRRLGSAVRFHGMRARLRELVGPDGILLVCNIRHPLLNALAGSLPNRKIGWIHCNAERYGRGTKERLNAKLFGIYQRILTCSAENRNDFAYRFPKLDMRTRWILNGVDRARVEERISEPIDPPGPYILFAGQLIRRKGVDHLLRAFADLAKVNSEHHLVLLGHGPDDESLRAQAKSLGLANRVHFRGFVRNVYPWMANADVFVLPSREEGLPLVLIEAMTAGAPTIATDCKSGPREILEGGRSGVLVPVDDRNALFSALRKIAGSEDFRRLYRRRSLERSRAFDMRTMTRQIVELADELKPALRRRSSFG